MPNAKNLRAQVVPGPRYGAKFRCEVARSSETRKLLGEQFLNFGPNFLEIGELWSTYFDVAGKF